MVYFLQTRPDQQQLHEQELVELGLLQLGVQQEHIDQELGHHHHIDYRGHYSTTASKE